MAVQTKIPASNVLAVDIRDTLNANGSSCTNDIISFFDSRAKINIWSFRKPYSYSEELFKLNNEQIRNLNCGLNPLSLGAYTQIPSKMDGNMNGWTYTRPGGGQTDPYRLGDYVGYYPAARPMIENFYVPDTASNQFQGTWISATAIVPSESDGVSVTLADLKGLSSCIAAVYIVNQSDTSRTRMYQGEEINNGVFRVDFDAYDLTPSGDWTVYPFLKVSDTSNQCYTVPNVSPKTINITQSNFSITCRAERRTDGTKAIDYTITIKNNTSQQTWKTNTWSLRFPTSKFEEAYKEYEMSGNLPSPITVNGNGTTTITGSIENINNTLWDSLSIRFWVSLNTGVHVQSFDIVEQNRE